MYYVGNTNYYLLGVFVMCYFEEILGISNDLLLKYFYDTLMISALTDLHLIKVER